jgi:hypothetical protein
MRTPSRRAALVALLSLLPTPALADTPSLTADQLRGLMHTYYDGERLVVVPFGLAGVAGIATGSLLAASSTDLARGAGWPVLVFGAVDLLAGVLFSMQAVSNRRTLDQLLTDDPKEFARRERIHILRIRDRFQPILLAVEGVIAGVGGIMAGGGVLDKQPTVEGVGLGLLAEAIVLFALDWTVLDRARAYAAGLEQFNP